MIVISSTATICCGWNIQRINNETYYKHVFGGLFYDGLAQRACHIKLRRTTRAQHAERVRSEWVRIDVSLLDADSTDYVPRMKQLIADHGTAPAALRFLLDFYQKNQNRQSD